jgi:chemotaxis protein MotB
VKPGTPRFASNWELSTARAVEVVKLLVESGVPPQHLSAAGYGEFAPVAPNTTPEGRAKNRRLEIAVETNPDETAKAPGAGDAPPAQAGQHGGPVARARDTAAPSSG